MVFKVILAILGVAIVFELALAIYFFRLTILRKDKPMVSKDEMGDGDKWVGYKGIMDEAREWLDAKGYEDVEIQSKDGLKLHGYYISSDKPSNKLVICVHGYTSKGMNECPSFAKAYADMGYSALIVDDRAHGKSEGKYVGFGILDRYDLLEWVRYAVKRFGNDVQIVLHGDSMGASTILMATGLAELPNNVKVAVADCAFTSPEEVFSHVLKRDYHIPKFPLMNITSIMSKRIAGYGYNDYSTLDAMKVTKTPTLFVAGKKDTFVPTYMTQENYDQCIAPKKIFWVDEAGHAAAFFEDNKLFLDNLKDFLSKYIV
ncbi:MAG: alpha/beta hydrolase [Ruminococcus sp.]|nr:alpha/beta hydrolase [Ruminococcus sp.]